MRDLPREFRAAELPAGCGPVYVFCGGCPVVGGPRYADDPGAASRFAAHPALRGWPPVVLTDQTARAPAGPRRSARFTPASRNGCRVG